MISSQRRRDGKVEIALDERCCGLRDDGVAVGAQASHSGGSPMSQRECAGFNWPPLSIPAEEPVSISPVAVSRAGCGLSFKCKMSSVRYPDVRPVAMRLGRIALRSTTSIVFGVGQPVNVAAVFRAIPPCRPGGTFAPVPSFALGVGQPASHATRPRSAFSGTFAFGFPPSFQSRVVGVGHPVQSLTDMGRADARSA